MCPAHDSLCHPTHTAPWVELFLRSPVYVPFRVASPLALFLSSLSPFEYVFRSNNTLGIVIIAIEIAFIEMTFVVFFGSSGL
jgi:hypothetical protein